MLHVQKKQGGYSLIEILVSIGVFSIVVFAAIGIFIVSQESVQIARNKTKALEHIHDYIEKVKNIKRYDWTSLINGKYIFVTNAGNLELQTTTTGETINGFTRYVEFSNGMRDSSGNIVNSGGTADPSTKQVSVTVSWAGIKPGTITETTYITRYLDNLPWGITTVGNFNDGTHSGTNTVNNEGGVAGGEVVLGAGGAASWCAPELVIAGMDLTGQGVAKAVTAIEGRAFAGTGDNSSGWTFSNINITNPTKPANPVASVLGYYNGGKSNDVFGETNYGYVAVNHPNPDVIILNLTSFPYIVSGQFNVPDSPSDGQSVYVYGNTGYVLSGNKLWNFDLTSKTDSRPAIDTDGVVLNGTGTSVVVSGEYAYVATNSVDNQLQIIDLSTSTNLTVLSSVNLDAAGATDVFVNSSSSKAYIVTNSSATQPEFFIIDITNKSNPSLVSGSTYDTNGMSPRGVEIVPGGKAIIVGTGGFEYQVISIPTTGNPSSCVTEGGLNIDSGIFDSASVLEADNDAYTYIVTGDASNEFRIIEGGPGGDFATSGVWESATFDADHSAAFNRFDVTFDKPSLTDIRFQVAIVDPGISGTCTDADFSTTNFWGPNPTSSEGSSAFYFQDEGSIPIDDDGIGFENPGRCARVRAYLYTTDFSQSPILYDITTNYSP